MLYCVQKYSRNSHNLNEVNLTFRAKQLCTDGRSPKQLLHNLSFFKWAAVLFTDFLCRSSLPRSTFTVAQSGCVCPLYLWRNRQNWPRCCLTALTRWCWRCDSSNLRCCNGLVFSSVTLALMVPLLKTDGLHWLLHCLCVAFNIYNIRREATS